jgi:hypothetical protein
MTKPHRVLLRAFTSCYFLVTFASFVLGWQYRAVTREILRQNIRIVDTLVNAPPTR